jgi:N-acetylmuramoyl-L-alanine amidase
MTGQNLYDKINSRVGCKYVLGVIAPKDDGNYKGPFDCAELASWGVYQTAGYLYGCQNNNADPHTAKADAYTGFWYRDAKAIGEIITVERAKRIPGAFVLRVAANGSIGHIACSDGLGGTAEAHSSKYGVKNDKIDGRRWDFGVLVPEISFHEKLATMPSIKPPVKVYRWTEPMMVSATVSVIQKKLKDLGFYTDKVDGWYGEKTWKAVRAYQTRKGLTVDGEVGRQTLTALGIQL